MKRRNRFGKEGSYRKTWTSPLCKKVFKNTWDKDKHVFNKKCSV